MTDYDIPLLPHTINGRTSMRSIADATEALRQAGHLPTGSVAQIRTIPIRLPSGEVTSIVLVIFQHQEEPSWGVALPSSRRFRCRTADGAKRILDIARLDRASAYEDGDVELSDGSRFRSVDMIPTRMPYELTPLQKRIVYQTLKVIHAKGRRYRGPATVNLKFLDYGALYGLKLPMFKVLEWDLRAKDPKLSRISRQTMAAALGACGLRRPRSGRLV